MTARDPLAELLATEIPDDIFACNRVWEAWSYGTMSQDDFTPANEESGLIAEIADAILAAGYVKPRVITSPAQLEALPFGSAVQTSDDSDTVVLKDKGAFFRNQSGCEVSATDLWRYGTRPFTVIYEPAVTA